MSFHVAFAPNQLGHGTNVSFTIHITDPGRRLPPPLQAVDLRFPEQLGVAVSGLGPRTCRQTTLEAYGPDGCPLDSRMGNGTATAEVPIGPETISENAAITILRAPENEGHIAMYYYVQAWTPVMAEVTLPGQLLPGPPPYETIQIHVPLIGALPDGPDVALTRIHATIGPKGITYYERQHGKRIPYKPKGILLPNKCPQHGFKFQALLTFASGNHSEQPASVACPRHTIRIGARSRISSRDCSRPWGASLVLAFRPCFLARGWAGRGTGSSA